MVEKAASLERFDPISVGMPDSPAPKSDIREGNRGKTLAQLSFGPVEDSEGDRLFSTHDDGRASDLSIDAPTSLDGTSTASGLSKMIPFSHGVSFVE